MTWLELQKALRVLNYDPGPLDGIPGPKTRDAVRRFQEINGLRPTGLVDPQTSARLAEKVARRTSTKVPSAGPAVPPWLAIARQNKGVAEIVGPRHSPTIMGWIAKLGIKTLGVLVKDDETPWCGTFAAYCISSALDAEPIPVPAVRASAFDTFGTPLDVPALGAVVRFARPGGGHVGFYEGEDATHIHCLGGNTGNKVGLARIEKSRLVAVRWPKTALRPQGGPVMLTPAGVPVSTDEA